MPDEHVLSRRTCTPCREGAPPLEIAEIDRLRAGTPKWEVVDIDEILRLRRAFPFEDLQRLADFQLRIMREADAQGHHPTLFVTRRKLGWRIVADQWTHKIHGLHENDFILAARIDRVWEETEEGRSS